MGSYNRRQRKSSSIFSIFKACCSSGGSEEYWDEAGNTGRIYPSDEDRGRWVGEPGIDRKATAFITRFHETHVLDPEQCAV